MAPLKTALACSNGRVADVHSRRRHFALLEAEQRHKHVQPRKSSRPPSIDTRECASFRSHEKALVRSLEVNGIG